MRNSCCKGAELNIQISHSNVTTLWGEVAAFASASLQFIAKCTTEVIGPPADNVHSKYSSTYLRTY